jgi:hypothetical protein
MALQPDQALGVSPQGRNLGIMPRNRGITPRNSSAPIGPPGGPPRRAFRPIAGIAPPADAIGAKRVILTHMGPDMFAHLDEVTEEIAEDGKIVEV